MANTFSQHISNILEIRILPCSLALEIRGIIQRVKRILFCGNNGVTTDTDTTNSLKTIDLKY